MNKTLIGGIAFVAGISVGILSTWQYFKIKEERRADEEIESVKALLKNDIIKEKEEHLKTIEQASEMNSIFQQDMKAYKEKLKEVDYSGYSKQSADEDETVEIKKKRPYLISEDEFGTYDDYDRVYVTYYDDGVLVDQDDEIIMDAEDQFGYECLKELDKEDGPAEIYVRNEANETEYNIVYDSQSYSDFYNSPDMD